MQSITVMVMEDTSSPIFFPAMPWYGKKAFVRRAWAARRPAPSARPAVLLLVGALLGSVATWFGAQFFAHPPLLLPPRGELDCPVQGCGHRAHSRHVARLLGLFRH